MTLHWLAGAAVGCPLEAVGDVAVRGGSGANSVTLHIRLSLFHACAFEDKLRVKLGLLLRDSRASASSIKLTVYIISETTSSSAEASRV